MLTRGAWASLILLAFACGPSDPASPTPVRPKDDATIIREPSSIARVTADGPLRQGFGAPPTDTAVTVHVVGTRLEGAEEVRVGPADKAIFGIVTENTPTTLAFTVKVPHGAPLGKQPLTARVANGTVSYADAVTIGPIVASPDGRDSRDASTIDANPASSAEPAGTEGSPFRSLTKAISVAGEGDTILLRDGTYDAQHGETFPTITSHSPVTSAPNVLAGLTIKGESAEKTRIVGPSSEVCAVGKGQVGLALAGDARIESLDVSGFCEGVSVNAGAATVVGVRVHHVYVGIYALGHANVTLESVDADAWADAVEAVEQASLHVVGGRLHHSWNGISFRSRGTLTVTGTEIDANGEPDDDGTGGIWLPYESVVTITDAKIHDNNPFGILTGYKITSLPLTVTRTSFVNNARAGLYIGGRCTVKARESTFADKQHDVWIESGAVLDFGTPKDPGKNTFIICGACNAFLDGRSAGNKLDTPPITVTGNTWIGIPASPPVGCSAADSSAATPRYWQIRNPGYCPSAIGNVILNSPAEQ
ncbi:right-handed parallel beta-helix repeat-containing protein [Pendulispora albinea]|uniref:Right-handed parallel beta-helix repeat-containing protein n=1 Tax=Pendulispora albinea TaxID=2741071 RepID=A0ABZ2LUJ8_9BACT